MSATYIPTTRAQQQAEPAPRRDPIGFVLFYKMDWCEKHPGLMFLAIGALIVLEGVMEQLL
ncbi:hypothetical protein AB595_21720 [Massilia sp. WF1]|uniref:hypothetical protein n=1 Tax=unclassified Massilia TaxID=2609279 RepID=UPI00064AE078|nr:MULTISPECIES: hypothetical protein [unclassified Massilia]ALK97003.1 hypothetical protein AM586_12800 [Massilia sp. WG5]KLU34717.1 hypothetical protein AB595_21720 [Massilia sp. WF1]